MKLESHDVGGLLSKLGIATDAPTRFPLELNLLLAQHAPNLRFRDVPERFGQYTPVPDRIRSRRWFAQLLQHSLGGLLLLVATRPAASTLIHESLDSILSEAEPPLADGAR